MAPRKPTGKKTADSSPAPKGRSKDVGAPKAGAANRRRKPVGETQLAEPPKSSGGLRGRPFPEVAEAFNSLSAADRKAVLSYIPTSSRQRLEGMLESQGTFNRNKVKKATSSAEAQPRDPQALYEYDAASQGLARAMERHRELSAGKKTAAPAKEAPDIEIAGLDSPRTDAATDESVMRGLTQAGMSQRGLDPRGQEVVDAQAAQSKVLGTKLRSADEGDAASWVLRAGKEADADPRGTVIEPVLEALKALGPAERSKVLDTLATSGGADPAKLGDMMLVEKLKYIPQSLRDGFALPEAGSLKPGLGGLAEDGPKMGAAARRKANAARLASMPPESIGNTVAELENITNHGGSDVRKAVRPEDRSVADKASSWDASSDTAARDRAVLIRKLVPNLDRMIAWQDKEHFGWDHNAGRGRTETSYSNPTEGLAKEVALTEGEQLYDPSQLEASGTRHSADMVADALAQQDRRFGRDYVAGRDITPFTPEELAARRAKYDQMAAKVKALESAHAKQQTPDSLEAVNDAMNQMLNALTIDSRADIPVPSQITNPKLDGEAQQREMFASEKPFQSPRERVLRSLAQKSGLIQWSGVKDGNMDAVAAPNATILDTDGNPIAVDDQTGAPVEQSEPVESVRPDDTGRRSATAGLLDDEDATTVNLDQIAPFWRANFPNYAEDGSVTYDNRPVSARLLAGLITDLYGADPNNWGDVDEFGRPTKSAESMRFAESITPLIQRSIDKYKDRAPSQYDKVGKWVGRNMSPATKNNFLQSLMADLSSLDAIEYPLRGDEADLSWQPDYQARYAAWKEGGAKSRAGRSDATYDAEADSDIDLDAPVTEAAKSQIWSNLTRPAPVDDSDIDLGEGDAAGTPAPTRPLPAPMDDEDINLGHSSDEPVYEDMDQNDYWQNSGDEDIDLGYNGGYLPALPMNRMRMGNMALAGLIA